MSRGRYNDQLLEGDNLKVNLLTTSKNRFNKDAGTQFLSRNTIANNESTPYKYQ